MAQKPAEAEVGGIAAKPFDHICALYRGRAERDRLMLPFLKDGLEAGDACLCLATDGESAHLGVDARSRPRRQPVDRHRAA